MLEQRLRGRSKDSEAAIQRRLQVARDEVAAFAEYDYIVVNDELTSAVDRLRGIVAGESCAPERAMRPAAAGTGHVRSVRWPVRRARLVRDRTDDMIDRCKLSNSFEFVVTAGARARQLLAGSMPRVDVGEHKKTTVAQTEVVTGRSRRSRRRIGQRVIGHADVAGDSQVVAVDRMLIALGVTGGIGAYKAVEVARGLQKRGHDVVAIMTHAADAVRRRRSRSRRSRAGASSPISSSPAPTPTSSTSRSRRSIDLLLIAPATANIIGKLANGIADDFLSTLYTATRAPVLMAPAMNTQMFAHEAVRRNLDTLAARGVRFVEPGEGYLACGWIGKGRLAEPDEIVAAAEAMLRPRRSACAGSACSSPPGRPTKTSIRCAISATARAAAWGSRSPPRRRGAAPR